MKRFFIAFFLSSCLLLFIKSSSSASEKVTNTAYDITYTVDGNGLTNVLFAINLTNTTSSQYATAYSLKVGFENIANIRAADPDGPITPLVKQLNDGFLINVVFNKQTAGKGKTLPFTISFTTPDVVQKNGRIWEINIPGIANKNDFTNLHAHVKVPSFLGKPTYIKPAITTEALDFSKEQLGKSGISLFFGDEQKYQFSLAYHLQNTNIFPVKTEIAIPPTTNYQKVTFESIIPPPENVRQDIDGNWLAQYSLKPSQKIDITAKGAVKISLHPRPQQLSEQERRLYLSEQHYWQKNKKIKDLADELKSPQAIYNYVVKNLTYDFSRVIEGKTRLGAEQALLHPESAVCLEFTDLFIAIARAAGIPARKVDGFAYTQNVRQRPVSLVKDVLHTWPEYYDDTKKSWIMIDPTWGNTTGGTDYFYALDFDHFAFTINGKTSTAPIPAGGYKLPFAPETKDVVVSLSQNSKEVTPKVSLSSEISERAFAGLPIFTTVIIKNKRGVVYPAGTIVVNSSKLSSSILSYSHPAIPPFGHIKIPLYLGRSSFLTNTAEALTIHVAGEKIEQNIIITPLFYTKTGIIGGGLLFAGITIILLIITKGTRRLPFFKQKR